jgi:hypothetical protein
MMRFGADSTNAIGNQRHLFDGAAYDESFKAAQFGDLEV